MPIDKANPEPFLDIEIMEDEESALAISGQDMPDIEIILEEDGSALIEIGEDEPDVPFYANLAEVLDPSDLNGIGDNLLQLFDADKESRADWEQMYAKGLDLLGLKIDDRTKPFRGAAGVVHPMLTEAIVQFQSQAMKELMPAGGPVRTQVVGKETLDKTQQAARVQDFMNYQITDVMQEYTPEMDQALFYTGYGGSTFKKVYFDSQLDRMVSKLCLADDVYIPYHGSSVMSQCPRITHRLPMDSNEYLKRVFAGEYLDLNIQADDGSRPADQIQDAVDRAIGVSLSGESEEIFLLEFIVNLDLPGFEDVDDSGEPTGIKLPYVVTLDESSGRVVGVRRNWKEEDPLKKRREYFVHYVLIEGLGAYGLGFVHLIGGLSKTATAALRQLLDAGTLSNLPAGFKAKGARIADDDKPIQPGEWRDIDAGGAELSSSLMPMPYKEPSQVLFQLMGFTVQAGNRLASIADMQVGDGNQQAAVGTTIAMLERGSMVMSAIHKRLHYSQSLEFKMLAQGFGEYLPDEYPYDVPGASRSIKRQDFNNMVAVLPVADPNIFSTAQRLMLAQTQLELAQSAPQMHNMYEAYYRVYAALNIRDIDGILRPQNTQMPKDPATENADVLDGMDLKAFAGQQHDAHMSAHLMAGLSPLIGNNPLAATTLQKHILEHVRLKAEEDTEVQLFQQYGMDPKGRVSDIQREGMIALLIAQYLQEVRTMQDQLAGGAGGEADPVVALKQQELELRAQEQQQDAQVDQSKLQLDAQKLQQDQQNAQARIQSQEDIAQLRAQVGRERVEVLQQNMQNSQKGQNDA